MIKLISLNIERAKHFDLVFPFLEKEAPDIVCLQELARKDIDLFEKELSTTCLFAGMANHTSPDDGVVPGVVGLGMFSKLPVMHQGKQYYWGKGECEATEYDFSSAEAKHATESYAVAYQAVEKNGEKFQVATTHFPWTPDGSASDDQRQDLKTMLEILEQLGDVVLCGDFNAPRDGEIFAVLAEKYKDDIPMQYKTSLDITIHRDGKTKANQLADKMVDGLFTTRGYAASDVRLEFGVSDHAAIVSTIAPAAKRR